MDYADQWDKCKFDGFDPDPIAIVDIEIVFVDRVQT